MAPASARITIIEIVTMNVKNALLTPPINPVKSNASVIRDISSMSGISALPAVHPKWK